MSVNGKLEVQDNARRWLRGVGGLNRSSARPAQNLAACRRIPDIRAGEKRG